MVGCVIQLTTAGYDCSAQHLARKAAHGQNKSEVGGWGWYVSVWPVFAISLNSCLPCYNVCAGIILYITVVSLSVFYVICDKTGSLILFSSNLKCGWPFFTHAYQNVWKKTCPPPWQWNPCVFFQSHIMRGGIPTFLWTQIWPLFDGRLIDNWCVYVACRYLYFPFSHKICKLFMQENIPFEIVTGICLPSTCVLT